ncbi:hypothetical protein L2E82_02121 [Cichorium intybus]|uniref:Uncharacterized protein n=1 Tax=Cichorium intybus TaxID=13427 RepID=A0ACB9H1K4_CICIN|nr:hypothetical protein L2E82_02121 [Cichorium intybus]
MTCLSVLDLLNSFWSREEWLLGLEFLGFQILVCSSSKSFSISPKNTTITQENRMFVYMKAKGASERKSP